ncbi:putative aldouronate transport system substrate-binding protein [Kribbella aluminosa]|uniref:Aldouronate transport system substrate-binding protein n=1 Tax=Kribbella aluminosa TaxID=416017 RepID=A0ABS4UJ20_9ACTN|nr:extracellular solute-binding protein [Kribbella aluminosa]MBP2351604.1 putative aldouronate transport system substrate-binding protein [Kribbella aluminosa]
MTDQTHPQIRRRVVLSAAVLLSGTACSGGKTSKLGQGAGQPPKALPPVSVPDMHASADPNVPPAYLRYPAAPFKSVKAKPGDGSTVDTFQVLFYPPPQARGQNPLWQQLETRLGVRINPNLVTSDLYDQKMATLAASGHLPDLMFLNRNDSASAGRLIQNGAILDLSPYLSGDAVNDYPNLGRLPTQAWTSSMVNGGIYVVPRPLDPVTGSVGLYRKDWARALGVDDPKNADDVYAMLTAFAKRHPAGNATVSWALGAWQQQMFNQMFGAPHGWRRNDDGTLTKDLETKEFENALDFMRRLWSGGVYHPDTATLNNQYQKLRTLFVGSQQIGMFLEGYISQFDTTGARGLLQQTNPKADARPFVPPGHDGGKATSYASSGYFGGMGIPNSLKNDSARVRMLLRLLDYYAAPFGSEEYLFMNYGQDGRHYKRDEHGNPRTTDKWSEVLALTYMCQPMDATLYFPSQIQDALIAQQGIQTAMPVQPDPTRQLYSRAALTQAGTLNQLNEDYLADIVTGRKPLTAIDEWRDQWRSRGGDTIRKEYESALRSLPGGGR